MLVRFERPPVRTTLDALRTVRRDVGFSRMRANRVIMACRPDTPPTVRTRCSRGEPTGILDALPAVPDPIGFLKGAPYDRSPATPTNPPRRAPATATPSVHPHAAGAPVDRLVPGRRAPAVHLRESAMVR